jgi:hypothetical protein
MKILILKSAVGPVGAFKKGEIRNIPDVDALPLIAAGIAERVIEKAEEERETATDQRREKRKR